MLDMYRRPDKLIQAMERLVPVLIGMGVDQSRRDGNPMVSLMRHKGARRALCPRSGSRLSTGPHKAVFNRVKQLTGH